MKGAAISTAMNMVESRDGRRSAPRTRAARSPATTGSGPGPSAHRMRASPVPSPATSSATRRAGRSRLSPPACRGRRRPRFRRTAPTTEWATKCIEHRENQEDASATTRARRRLPAVEHRRPVPPGETKFVMREPSEGCCAVTRLALLLPRPARGTCPRGWCRLAGRRCNSSSVPSAISRPPGDDADAVGHALAPLRGCGWS